MLRFLGAYRSAEIPDSGPIPFVASTEGTKRDGLDVDSAGWKLDNYRKNPVVLISHDYFSLPIGRADVEVKDKQLLANVTFDQGDERAREAERKVRAGFVSTVSVGFNILSMSDSVQNRTKEQELLDISLVAVPGDPDALKRLQQRGITDDLQDLVSRLSDAEPTVAPSEFVWPGVAALMARCFLDTSDDDGEREAQYRRLAREYRTLGKEPPEFLTRSQLTVLDDADIRALFLCDEGALLGWQPDGVRAGAVLSSRNYGDLEQAATLIRGVLERATKEDPSEDDAKRAFLSRFYPTSDEPGDLLRRLAG